MLMLMLILILILRPGPRLPAAGYPAAGAGRPSLSSAGLLFSFLAKAKVTGCRLPGRRCRPARPK